jgi:superfamily II DNA or RNA helicase
MVTYGYIFLAMQIQLRPYQQAAIEQVRAEIQNGAKRIILCAPTGAGKTVMFSFIVASALKRGKRVMIVTDRIELLTQAGGALQSLGINPARIEAGIDPGKLEPCYTAMVETLNRRLSRLDYLNLIESLDVIIFDEAHKQSFNKLFPYIHHRTVVIGATATPHREGGQESLDEFYEAIVNVASIPELIQLGFLAHPLSYGVPVDLSAVHTRAGDYDLNEMGREYSQQKVYRGVIANYNTICPGKKAILFAANIASSVEVCAELVRAGLPAQHLDSNMSAEERRDALSWFADTGNGILCNVGILTTGFDEPTIEAVILYRATKSLPLFLQMVGRGSRVLPGKRAFHILDFGNNIQKHGFWEEDRVWGLEKKKKKDGVAPVKECKSCHALVRASAKECDYCGAEFERSEKEKEEDEVAALKLLTKREAMSRAVIGDLSEKARLVQAGVIKATWVLHNLKSFEEAKAFTVLLGYKAGWWFHNRNRFQNLI